jgi:hypothetical protein
MYASESLGTSVTLTEYTRICGMTVVSWERSGRTVTVTQWLCPLNVPRNPS